MWGLTLESTERSRSPIFMCPRLQHFTVSIPAVHPTNITPYREKTMTVNLIRLWKGNYWLCCFVLSLLLPLPAPRCHGTPFSLLPVADIGGEGGNSILFVPLYSPTYCFALWNEHLHFFLLRFQGSRYAYEGRFRQVPPMCPTCNTGEAADWPSLAGSTGKPWSGEVLESHPGDSRALGKCRGHCGSRWGGTGRGFHIHSGSWPEVIWLAKHQKYWKH